MNALKSVISGWELLKDLLGEIRLADVFRPLFPEGFGIEDSDGFVGDVVFAGFAPRVDHLLVQVAHRLVELVLSRQILRRCLEVVHLQNQKQLL